MEYKDTINAKLDKIASEVGEANALLSHCQKTNITKAELRECITSASEILMGVEAGISSYHNNLYSFDIDNSSNSIREDMCAIAEELGNVQSAYLQKDMDGMMLSVNKVLRKIRGRAQ